MAHALLSPSAASRWLVCTPSPRLEEGYPDSSSEFAEEGTLAHSYAEVYLRYHDDNKGLKKALKKMESDPLYAKYYSTELDEYAQGFAEYVLRQCTGDYFLAVEQKLDLTNWVPEAFGTGDAIVVKDGILDLNDLKYGRGVKVSSVENKQLMLYALGCVEKYGWIYDFHTVRLNIYQPRLYNISVWSITVEELLKWAEEELTPKADKAFKGEGDLVAGEHCRFCKAKAECKALADIALSLAKDEFADEAPAKLSPEEIAEIIPKMSVAEIYIKAVREHAYAKLLSGEGLPGYKLVKGKSTRFLKDTKAIKEHLLAQGIDEEVIMEPVKERQLLGLGALEKALKPKRFQELVSPWVGKKESSPTMVPVSDPREEYSSIDADFADELNDDNLDWLSE